MTNGEVHYQAIRNVTETYNTAACTVIMDLTVEAEAFGCTISMPEHEVPSVTGRLVYDEESVNRLQVPSLSVGRMPEYLKANRLAIENIRISLCYPVVSARFRWLEGCMICLRLWSEFISNRR